MKRARLASAAAAFAYLLAGCAAPARFIPPSPPPISAPTTTGAPNITGAPSTTATPTAAVVPGATRRGHRPPVVNNGPRAGNLVALTFDADLTVSMRAALDSGQVKSYANLRILDQLERGQVPATFFLTGMWVERYPDVTRRIAKNDRFELANHTYGHEAYVDKCYGLPRQPRGRMTSDVDRTFNIIASYGGRQTRYFRFPGLCHDARALDSLAPLGVTVVDGDVVSGDPFATRWQPIVNAVLTKVRPGSVIILHVTEANARMTDDALPHILEGLRARNLQPARLSEVLAAH